MNGTVSIHPGSQMSFTGATRWVTHLGWPQAGTMWRTAQQSQGWQRAGWLAATAGIMVFLIGVDWLLLAAIWAAILAWYVLIFGLFGIFVIPWRIHQRGKRRSQAQQAELIHEVRELRAGR